MLRILKLLLVFLLLPVLLTAQQRGYFSYLSDTAEASFLDFEPAVYPSKDGGFFMGEGGRQNACKITKFDAKGLITWEKIIEFHCDILYFTSLKEGADGSIYVLINCDLARNGQDGIIFKLNAYGEVLFYVFATPDNIRSSQVAYNIEIIGDEVFVWGIFTNNRNYYWPSYLTILKTNGELVKHKSWNTPPYEIQNIQLISYHQDTLVFLSLIRDSTYKVNSPGGEINLGVFKYYRDKDTFEYFGYTDSAGSIKYDSKPKGKGGDITILTGRQNNYDSSIIITFDVDNPNEIDLYHLYKINKNGEVKINKIFRSYPDLKSSSKYISQIFIDNVNQIYTFEYLAYFTDLEELIEVNQKVTYSNELEEILRVPSFFDTENYKSLKKNYALSVCGGTELFQSFAKPSIIFDKAGDLIYCAACSQLNNLPNKRILVLKMNPQGEIVSTASVDKFSKEEYQIYPNPCTDLMSINLPNETTANILVKDLKGNTIMQMYAKGISNINTSTLFPAVYILEIQPENSSKIIHKKFVKMQ